VPGNSVPMGSILLNEAKEPLHSLLIIIMLLTFDDNLLATIDELITAILREVLLNQEFATSLELIMGLFAVLLGDAIGETALYNISERAI
jgi:hypothetical protein